MNQDFELIVTDGERRIDSRVIAKGIRVHHDNLMQTIEKYRDRLEKYGLLLFQTEAVKKAGARGTKYALLNKEQFGYLLMFVRVTDVVRNYREHVYGAFLAYETQQLQTIVPRATFLKALRMRALVLLDHVADDDWTVLCELAREGYRWEEMLNTRLDEGVKLERSVERCWWNYARTVLGLGDHVRRKRTIRLPDGRRVSVWAYPIKYLSDFRRWLSFVYFPEKFPIYLRRRITRLAKQQQIKARDNKELLLPQSEVDEVVLV